MLREGSDRLRNEAIESLTRRGLRLWEDVATTLDTEPNSRKHLEQ